MLKSSKAEWLLACFIGCQQAEALIGDLLEQRTERGPWWFWWSFSGLLLTAAWRPLVGFIAAVFVSAAALNRLASGTIGMWVTVPLLVVMNLTMVMWFVAVYSVVRYGVRDALAQVAGAAALLSTTSVILWHYPAAPQSAGAIAIGTALVFIMIRSHRWAIGTLLATSVIFYASSALTAYSGDAYLYHVLHIRFLGSVEMEQHRSILYLLLALRLTGEAVTAFVCAKLHHKFVKRQDQELITAT